MNTGIYDAINLGWKLGGAIKGWFRDNVVETYDAERRIASQTLVQLDKGFSATLSGKIPNEYKSTYSDPNELFAMLFSKTIKFSVGLGISFAPNLLNRSPEIGTITTGCRAPDCLLHKPGLRLPLRLFDITKNTGIFWILVFVGQPFRTCAGIRSFREYIDGNSSFTKIMPSGSFRFLTIVSGEEMQADVAMGVQKFGKAYYDVDNSAHSKYGISPKSGAVVVLRPDGIFAYAAGLDQGCEIGSYFASFIGGGKGSEFKV
jgi:phenol 2-monooxygenase (NADPH)